MLWAMLVVAGEDTLALVFLHSGLQILPQQQVCSGNIF